jgi:tetratricopeptide (TPR) repeat protein
VHRLRGRLRQRVRLGRHAPHRREPGDQALVVLLHALWTADLFPHLGSSQQSRQHLPGPATSDQAAAEFRRAIALNPADAAAHNNLGLALLDLGRPDEARAAFEAALRVNPTYSTAHSNLGNHHFRRGQLAAAAEAYRAAIRLDPGFAQAHNNLGSVYFNMGQLAEAEQAYRRALALDPRLEEVRRNLEAVVKARAVSGAPGAVTGGRAKPGNPELFDANPLLRSLARAIGQRMQDVDGPADVEALAAPTRACGS